MRSLHASLSAAFLALVTACGSNNDTPSEPADPGEDAGVDAPTPEPTAVGCPSCTVLLGGRVFDGSSAYEAAVVVRDDVIEDVVRGEVVVTDGEVIDTTGATVMPGMMDLHVHTPAPPGPYGYYDVVSHVDGHLKAMLRNGVTSFLDLGSDASMIFELRERIRESAMLGPRMFAAGPMFTPTGGHPCYAGSPPSEACVFADDAETARAGVEALVPVAPDLVKVIIEPGSAAYPLPRISGDALQAVHAAAEAHGLKVIAHVSSSDDVELALDAGIVLFAHMPQADLLPEALVSRMADRGAIVVPTLAVVDALYRLASDDLPLEGLEEDVDAGVLAAFEDESLVGPFQTPERAQYFGEWRTRSIENLRRCREAGVIIAAGTDAGNPGTFHGIAVQNELALYVEAGMSPSEALTAATKNAAELLGRADLRRIEPGARADLLIVRGDPTEDIRAVANVERVFLGGTEVDVAALAVNGTTSLVSTPVTGLGDGEPCLHAEECGVGYECTQDQRCRPTCSTTKPCAPGSACFPSDTLGTQGYCMPGDGCDPLGQDCANGAACVWLGNAATLCWYAGEGEAGQACSEYGTCAPGFQCGYYTNKCVKLCDPASSTPECEPPQTCHDRSASAGVTVGECG